MGTRGCLRTRCLSHVVLAHVVLAHAVLVARGACRGRNFRGNMWSRGDAMGLISSRSSTLLRLTVLMVLVGGCASAGVPVTGKNPEDPSWKGSQSETAISVANFQAKSVIAIAFNDGTNANGKIQYTPTTRTVLAGATLMGWAYSEDKA